MNKVKYTLLYFSIFSFEKNLKRKQYLHIKNLSIDEFLEYNPPCKECIVQATCLHNSTDIVTEYTKYLYLEMCNELKVFIDYNEYFYKTLKGIGNV